MTAKQTLLEIVRDAKQLLKEEAKHRNVLFSPYRFSQEKPKLIQRVQQPKAPLPPQLPPQKKVEVTPAPAPAPPKSEKIEPKSEKFEFAHDLQKLIEKACPHVKLKEAIPSDKEAVQRKNAWKVRNTDVEILLLEMSEDPKKKTLLANMASALLALGKKVEVVETSLYEKENGWEAFLDLPRLSHVIAPPLEHWKAPLLQQRVIINAATNESRLGPAKLLFLPPLEHLLSDLQLKLKVWKWLLASLQA